jgi:hypothetical protein
MVPFYASFTALGSQVWEWVAVGVILLVIAAALTWGFQF